MPPRPGVGTRRERIEELFEPAATLPLTVVRAPAGYGKTTAVREWLASRGRRSTWLPLRASDDDLENLFPRLLSLWGDIATSFGEGLSVVLDDYQLLTRPAAHRAVETMLDRLPAGVGMVVVSRTPPPLRLGRRRAAGALLEVDREDLTFTDAEAKALLDDAFGLALDPGQLEEVTTSVAGWPAGLSLVGGSLTPAPDRDGFERGLELARGKIASYLREELLRDCDPDLRAFLLRGAILDRLHPSLCVAVLEDARAGELLAAAGEAQLLRTDPRDPAGWVRLLRPFREFLRREEETLEVGAVPGLHLRASRWYEEAGMLEESIAHARLAGDESRATALLGMADPPVDPTDGGLRGTLPTRAERRVLALLARGLTFSEVAADLYLSVNTVKSHARRLYRRLGVNSRQAAVEVARRRGLLG